MSIYNASKITQLTRVNKIPGTHCTMLQGSIGEGYKNCLKKQYMGEVRRYLESYQSGTPKRILFVTPDKKLARQAVMVILSFARDLREEEDEYEYDSIPGEIEEEKPMETLQEAILISRGSGNDLGGNPMMDGFMLVGDKEEPEFGKPEQNLNEVAAILYEMEAVGNPEICVNEVLSYVNPNIFVFLKPTESYEYIAKRLCFEGDYKIINLGTPAISEYLEYAKDYLTINHAQCPDEVLEKMLADLQAYRGELMEEQDIYRHLGKCLEAVEAKPVKCLSAQDVAVSYVGSKISALEEMEKLVGLSEVKDIFERKARAKRLLKDKAGLMHSNFILEGAPGTGKSKTARLFAKRMAELGGSNGRFVDAARSDLIGKYLGHTAANIRRLFQKADGGVLFIDEASFLIGNDNYVKEAVIELVRYMELYPQTSVFFATYPEEGEQLLHVDPGFQSRISRVIVFPNYSEEELYEILEVMADDYGFRVEAESKDSVLAYIDKIHKEKDYGNAREMRKLLEAAIEECAFTESESSTRVLAKEHFERATEYLLKERKAKNKNSFGFQVMGG